MDVTRPRSKGQFNFSIPKRSELLAFSKSILASRFMRRWGILRYCAKTKDTLVERPTLPTSQKVVDAITEQTESEFGAQTHSVIVVNRTWQNLSGRWVICATLLSVDHWLTNKM